MAHNNSDADQRRRDEDNSRHAREVARRHDEAQRTLQRERAAREAAHRSSLHRRFG